MNKEGFSVYTAGLLQGIALVVFPAASTILTNPNTFHFTNTDYGSLFIPEALFSILTALFNPLLCRKFTAKKILILGLVANFLSMTFLALSTATMSQHMATYILLIMATSCLGFGFGMVVPTINRMVERLYPKKSDTAILSLNALLGVGTTLAPVFIASFTAMGFWWGLPLSLALAICILLFFTFNLHLPEEKIFPTTKKHESSKTVLFASIFVAFAFLYGIIETLNGNWMTIYLSEHLNATINIQSLALTSFWGMVTFGRFFFACMSKFLSEQAAFQIAPFISSLAFFIIASLVSGQEYWAIIAFGLTGFGCSVLLPLLISFGGKQLKSIAASVPGMIISSYLLGYGVAAFGVGPLEEFGHVSLRTIYVLGAIISLILGLLSLYIVRKRKNKTKEAIHD